MRALDPAGATERGERRDARVPRRRWGESRPRADHSNRNDVRTSGWPRSTRAGFGDGRRRRTRGRTRRPRRRRPSCSRSPASRSRSSPTRSSSPSRKGRSSSTRRSTPTPAHRLRHLLAHASGMAPDERKLIAPPATRRIYSNAGFEVDRRPPRRGDEPHRARTISAKPCSCRSRWTRRRSRARPRRARSSATDLARFATELLTPTLIAPTTLDQATAVQLARARRCAAGLRASEPERLGSRLRAPRRQATSLDRARWVTADVRPLRSVRHVPLDRSGRARRLRLPRRCRLRAVGDRRVAGVQRCGSGSGGGLTGSPSRSTTY